MAYLFYSISFVLLVFATVLWFTRSRWAQYLPLPIFIHRYAPIPSSFMSDAEAGLSSSSFSLADNIGGADSRGGLDDKGKKEVQRIMKQRSVGFDEARRIMMEERFGKNGIGPDGRPRDPKFISFS